MADASGGTYEDESATLPRRPFGGLHADGTSTSRQTVSLAAERSLCAVFGVSMVELDIRKCSSAGSTLFFGLVVFSGLC